MHPAFPVAPHAPAQNIRQQQSNMTVKKSSFFNSYNVAGLLPYALITIGLVFNIGAMASFALAVDKPSCQMYDSPAQAYSEVYGFVKDNISRFNVDRDGRILKLDDLFPSGNTAGRWSSSCHFGQSWLFFGFFTCLFGFALLFVPAIVWKFPRFTISALPFVLGGLVFAAFWNFVSVFSFFGLGDAWTYKYKCIIKPDQSTTCAYLDSDNVSWKERVPHPNVIGLLSDSVVEGYEPIFKVFSLQSYATSCAVLVTLGLIALLVGAPVVWVQYRGFKASEGGSKMEVPSASPARETSNSIDANTRTIGISRAIRPVAVDAV